MRNTVNKPSRDANCKIAKYFSAFLALTLTFLIINESLIAQAQEAESSRKQILEKSREYFREGERLFNQGDYSGADEKFKKAQRLLECLQEKQIQEQARQLEAVDYAQQLKEGNPDFHYNLAIEYLKAEKFNQAAEELHKVIRLNPEDEDAHYNLGVLYENHLGDRKQAKFHYRQYLKLAPAARADVNDVKEWIRQIDERSEKIEKRIK